METQKENINETRLKGLIKFLNSSEAENMIKSEQEFSKEAENWYNYKSIQEYNKLLKNYQPEIF